LLPDWSAAWAMRRATGQGDRVEDQHDLTIAKHRRTVDTDHPGQLRADVLDDDFRLPCSSSTCTATRCR
jgi:hypothetical protein